MGFPTELTTAPTTLLDCVRCRATLYGDLPAVTFLSDETFSGDDTPRELTYAQLWQQVVSTGELILQTLGENGERQVDQAKAAWVDRPRVLLLYPPGAEFLIAFLGAQLAGCIPVPTVYPRPIARCHG